MTKRLIDIDDDLLDQARRELNTTGVTDTVRSALKHAAAISARSREVEWLVAGGMAPMADRAERDKAWRSSRGT